MNDSMDSGVFTLGGLLRPVLRDRILIGLVTGVGIVLGVVHWLLVPKEYEARIVMIPAIEGGGSLLGGAQDLAALAGIRLGSGSDPSLYYRDILMSDLLLEKILREEFDQGVTVAAALGGGEGEDPGESVRRLRGDLAVSRDNRTGIVKLSVQTSDRDLSRFIADGLVGSLDRFLAASRSRRTGEQLEFLEAEIVRADQRLDDGEKALAAFRERNRLTHDSPELQREEARLRREVLIREGVVVELRKNVELLRLTADSGQAQVETIEPARAFEKPAYPVLLQSVFVGFLLGLVASLAFVYGRAYLAPAVAAQLAES